MSERNRRLCLIFISVIIGVVLCGAVLTVIVKRNAVPGKADSENEISVASEKITENGNEDETMKDNETADIKQETEGLSSSFHSTGELTETGDGYEGIKGTGEYNYGEALQKSLIFYELQRSGKLPENTRCNWRGDSSLNDGADVGLDLTGGWYDAGDNVKFGLPMAYSAAMLGWSVLEDKEAYEEAGQLEYARSNIKWANDYFIKCHPEEEVFYYQVGDGNADHTYWGSAETVEYRMDRPSYAVTKDAPGSTVCGETAAALAICALVYEDTDEAYSGLCLKHAKSLYDFARKYQSDDGYTAANGFYNSWSGFYDELAWAGMWLYKATGEAAYLENAKSDYQNAGQDYKWAMCWDDVHIGAAVLLAEETKDTEYCEAVEKHLAWWTKGTEDGERITYTDKGLAWLDSWGSLRYATTTAFISLIYSELDVCSKDNAELYAEFAESQANYALGSTGFSFEIGMGDNYPKHPHHRTAQGSYCDNMNEPSEFRHTLYGALVGGPQSDDSYIDEVSNYTTNEVACDYNAGFTGLLAKLYSKYHGETLVNFGAVEPVGNDEFTVLGGINVSGDDFIEIRAFICNKSAWPARVPQNPEFRYYMDLSEVYENGGTIDDIEVTTNYSSADCQCSLVEADKESHICYLCVDFKGMDIYPGGQDKYKKEIQIRIRNTGGRWDDENDPSFENMVMGGNELLTGTVLLDGENVLFGNPDIEIKTESGRSVKADNDSSNNSSAKSKDKRSGNVGDKESNEKAVSDESSNDKAKLSVSYSSKGSAVNSISGTILFTALGNEVYDTSKLEVRYYFNSEGSDSYDFACYHAAVNEKDGTYHGLNGFKGNITAEDNDSYNMSCSMKTDDSVSIKKDDALTINFSINHKDWSNMDMTNDYSAISPENICVFHDGKLILGCEP